jgi:Ca-activated chloride channel family protein
MHADKRRWSNKHLSSYRRLSAFVGGSLFLTFAGLCLSQYSPTFRSTVRLVHLLVNVKDAAGNTVANLTRDNFTIKDNGIPQKISVYERQTDQPLSVAVMIDNSGSTAKDLKYEVDSVSRFARALFDGGNPQDRAALYSFNWEVVKHTAFTRDASRIDRELHGLRGEAGTSLYDAIYLAANEIYDRPGRHVLVIVTDGGDTTSSKDYRAAIDAAQRADAVIYPVLVIPIENEAGRNIGGENALTTLSQGTGGRVFLPTVGAALDQAFAQIINELRTQYFLAYYPANIPPAIERFHRLVVEIDRPGLRISTRSGYYGDSDSGGSGTMRMFAPPTN